MTITFEQFKKDVLSIGFSQEKTQFNDLSAPHVGTWYQAQEDFSGVIYDGKYQVLINGANTGDPLLKHEDIKKAETLAERRANCWEYTDWQSVDTYDDATFDFDVD